MKIGCLFPSGRSAFWNLWFCFPWHNREGLELLYSNRCTPNLCDFSLLSSLQKFNVSIVWHSVSPQDNFLIKDSTRNILQYNTSLITISTKVEAKCRDYECNNYLTTNTYRQEENLLKSFHIVSNRILFFVFFLTDLCHRIFKYAVGLWPIATALCL